jgi:hypothetical protein
LAAIATARAAARERAWSLAGEHAPVTRLTRPGRVVIDGADPSAGRRTVAPEFVRAARGVVGRRRTGPASNVQGAPFRVPTRPISAHYGERGDLVLS